MLDTPVLLITFNRPEHAQKVLDAVRLAEPADLYVFQDGARAGNAGDAVRCSAVREVISHSVTWPCRFHTFYSDKNLGCGPGPAAALSWFFGHVEEGIILEDDAVPHPDFFRYAEELLVRYKDYPDIRAIGSMNVDTQKWGDGSYYFSMMNRNLCAWATWKRAWLDFDFNLAQVSRHRLIRALKKYGCGAMECAYWGDRLDDVHKDACGGKSWDMQFFMSIWLRNGKGIIPNVNLSSNIGTVGDATHSMASGNMIDNVPTEAILPLVHPSSLAIQDRADREFHFRYFEPGRDRWPFLLTTYNLLNRRIKRLVGHNGPWIKR